MKGHQIVISNVVTLIRAGKIVGYMVEYELVKAHFRKTINLIKWKQEIANGVHAVLPNAKVAVFKDFYRIIVTTVTDLPTFKQVQQIGEKIASHQHIGKNVTTHTYISKHYTFDISNKYFVRKEQSVKAIYLK
jgi:hypothetical protein